MRCHGKSEPYFHAGGIKLDGRVYVFFHAGEVHDFVEFGVNFAAGHAEDGAVHEDVFASGEFGVKSGAYFEQGGDAAPEAHFPAAGFGDAGEDFEQRTFPCPIVTDDTEDFALLHLKFYIAQCPEHAFVLVLEAGEVAELAEVVQGSAEQLSELSDEGIGAFFFEADAVAFGEALDFYDGVAHGVVIRACS